MDKSNTNIIFKPQIINFSFDESIEKPSICNSKIIFIN